MACAGFDICIPAWHSPSFVTAGDPAQLFALPSTGCPGEQAGYSAAPAANFPAANAGMYYLFCLAIDGYILTILCSFGFGAHSPFREQCHKPTR